MSVGQAHVAPAAASRDSIPTRTPSPPSRSDCVAKSLQPPATTPAAAVRTTPRTITLGSARTQTSARKRVRRRIHRRSDLWGCSADEVPGAGGGEILPPHRPSQNALPAAVLGNRL